MGYYNNNGRYNNYGGGRNNGGYRDNGYNRGYRDDYRDNRRDDFRDDRRDYQPQNSGKFDIGDVCTVIGTDIKCKVIRIGREQYECRIFPQLNTEWFYENELELVADSVTNN